MGNSKKTLSILVSGIVILSLFAIASIFMVSQGGIFPPELASYYGRVMPSDNISQSNGSIYCTYHRDRPLEQLQKRLTAQPTHTCFDTMDELHQWISANKHFDQT